MSTLGSGLLPCNSLASHVFVYFVDALDCEADRALSALDSSWTRMRYTPPYQAALERFESAVDSRILGDYTPR